MIQFWHLSLQANSFKFSFKNHSFSIPDAAFTLKFYVIFSWTQKKVFFNNILALDIFIVTEEDICRWGPFTSCSPFFCVNTYGNDYFYVSTSVKSDFTLTLSWWISIPLVPRLTHCVYLWVIFMLCL